LEEKWRRFAASCCKVLVVKGGLGVLRTFITDIPEKDLNKLIARTYTKEVFGTIEITPLKNLEKGLALLQLSNGPTLAFKDVPLQLVGNLMEYVLAEKGGILWHVLLLHVR